MLKYIKKDTQFSHLVVTYTLELFPEPVNDTRTLIFHLVRLKHNTPSQKFPHTTLTPITHILNYQKNHIPLPAPYLKNKSGGSKGLLGRPDFHSKDLEHVKHMQKILVTPGCNPGIYGPDKGGVDWAFGSFIETAEMNSVVYTKRFVIHRQRSVCA